MTPSQLDLVQRLGVEIVTFSRGRRSHGGAVETNPTRNDEVVGSIPGPAQWVEDLALL